MRLKQYLRLMLSCATVAGGCGGETEGELVTIEIAVKSAPAGTEDIESFETDTGYRVTLEEASVRIGPLFAFSPEATARTAQSAWELLRDGFVATAHAHGGIDLASGRMVRAEWLDPVTIDALDVKTQVLGEVQATQGVVDSVTIELSRLADEGAQVNVRGESERARESLTFEGALGLDDAPVSGRRVELVHEPIELSDGGRLTIIVHPDRLLRGADLARAPVEDGVSRLTMDSQPGRAFAIAARSPTAFSVEWRP